MNAKKIMGAVLVAFLAAALFIGAGAAVDDGKDFGTVFIYQNTTETDIVGTDIGLTDGIWTGENGATITVTDGVVYPGANFVAGTYKYNGNSTYVTYPTATYAVGAEIGTSPAIPYLVANGGNVYNDSTLDVTVKSPAKGIDVLYVLITLPNGTALNKSYSEVDGILNALNTEEGTYKVQAIFDKTHFVAGVPANLLLDANALTYTIVGEDDATLAVSADTLFAGEGLTVTVKGTPGTKYAITLNNVKLPQGQFVNTTGDSTTAYFVMPNNGEASFQAAITDGAKDEAVIKLFLVGTSGSFTDDDLIEEATIAVSAAQITATLGASSYFVGDEITITGTSTAGIDNTYDFCIEGTNFKKTNLSDYTPGKVDFEKSGKTWEVVIETEGVKDSDKKMLDVGTYTITIEKAGIVYKTIAVALKQPFISIVEAPEVIVQGEKAEFIINAEAATAVKFYIFGTNYFFDGGKDGADKDTTNQFTLKLSEDNTSAKNMSTGQYFAVFQHPMYDGDFNIMVNDTTFYLNTSGNAVDNSWTPKNGASTKLFNVYDRQTANAAQALCDALDSQNIDDMYVKYSFFVVGEDASFTISEIPSTIAQGETLTISGVSTAAAGDTVKVEMLSTAFAAVPKETVGSAAFIVVTTDVAEDGTWEVTLDTSDLNVDEYSLKVACGDDTWKNVKINVVEGADTPDTPDTPDVPEQPENPTEPEAPVTPGFGALAALAGLGAVAVLLLRRE